MCIYSWIILILLFSLLLALSFYRAFVLYDSHKKEEVSYKNAPFSWKFNQVWSHFVPLVVSGVMLYYLVEVRWDKIVLESTPSFADFVLVFFFLISVTGLMPYLLRNITEGINAVLKRILNS